MKRRLFTKEELSECFRINEQGKLERLNGKYKEETWTVVECVDNCKGYCRVKYRGYIISYHTIVWILTNGTIEDDEAVLDHTNGDKLDNRVESLRLTTQRENCQNQVSHRNGRLRGCCLHKQRNRWQAGIVINGKQMHLGYYKTEQEAHQIYCKACELIELYVDDKQFRNLLK